MKGEEWRGPARVLGIDKNKDDEVGTVWLQHEAGTVAAALHLLRPPTTSELYAWAIMSPGMRPQLTIGSGSGQTAFHDYRPKKESRGGEPAAVPIPHIPARPRATAH